MDDLDWFDYSDSRVGTSHPSFTKMTASDYDNLQFRERFRMTKESFYKLLELIHTRIRLCDWNKSSTTTEQQLLVALRFYATGSIQQIQGDLVGFTQPTICRIVQRVSAAIAGLANDFIKFPSTENLQTVKNEFYNIAQFPGVIGAIDGTHIEVRVPKESQERFRNRKNRVSLNVQAVVDAKMKFTNVVARWPGSVHDSRVFRNSRLYDFLQSNNLAGHLLGDSAYPCTPYLLTPLQAPVTLAEKKYQKSHVKTRNIVERTFGAWKAKFYCLHIPLRIKLRNSLNVIIACAVIWNFLIENQEHIEDEIDENAGDSNNIDLLPGNGNITDINGTAKRAMLINQFFSK